MASPSRQRVVDPEPDGSTRMRLRNRGQAAGFSKLMSPLMRPAIRRANRKDLTKLKAILESQPVALHRTR